MPTANLYPGLIVSLERLDGKTETLYHIDSISIDKGRIRIWFLDQASEGHTLELDANDFIGYHVSLNTGATE